MHETPKTETGLIEPLTAGEQIDEADDVTPSRSAQFSRAAIEQRIREDISSRHDVAWVRLSDLISSGAGRIAGRGIDFEAELARRLRHPTEIARQAMQRRRSALPPLDAFGRGHESVRRDTVGRR